MRCLVQFFKDFWFDFRKAEFNALLKLFNLSASEIYSTADGSYEHIDFDQTFLIVELPSDEIARKLCARSLLIKAIFEVWAQEPTVGAVVERVDIIPGMEDYYRIENTWSFQVDSLERKLSAEQKQHYRSLFTPILKFKGPVTIVKPSIELWLVLDFENNPKTDITLATSEVPSFVGRCLAKGGMRSEINHYDLKKRLYLGPTSLDETLALIMANISLVEAGTLCYDPFVGTASILIALSHFGAICSGGDIDPRVLRGDMYAGKADRSTDLTKRDIWENFKAYGLAVPDLIRVDNHLFDRHCRLEVRVEACSCSSEPGSAVEIGVEGEGLFDAIVTDPPYGIRAGARKSGKKDLNYVIEAHRRDDHIPSTQAYPVEEVMLDLLHTAACLLVKGGILTYLIPTTYDFTVQDLPIHPCLQITQICHQPLSSRHGRRAVVMEKHCSYGAEEQREFTMYKARVAEGLDEGFSKLSIKLEAALAADAFENDEVVKNASKRRLKRATKKAEKMKNKALLSKES